MRVIIEVLDSRRVSSSDWLLVVVRNIELNLLRGLLFHISLIIRFNLMKANSRLENLQSFATTKDTGGTNSLAARIGDSLK